MTNHADGKKRAAGSRRRDQNRGRHEGGPWNEQFNYVVKGTLSGTVNGVPVTAPAGTLVYIPANAPHTLVATPEQDVVFLALKDLSHGIIGRAVDGTMSGPHYEPGFGPRNLS